MNKEQLFSSSATTTIDHYRSLLKRRLIYILLLSITLVFAFVADLTIGSQGLSLVDFWHGLTRSDNISAKVIVWEIRMPSTIMAVLIGMALAISGAQMQTVLQNPLADPFTLGLSSAAGFGAALAIVLGHSILSFIPLPEQWFVAANAFLFSLITALLISAAGRIRALNAQTVTLLGIAVMFSFNALLTLLEYIASADQLQELVFWMMGSLSKASWQEIQILSIVLACVIPLLLRNAWQLTAMQANETMASVQGISTERLRIQILVLVSLLTATAVSFVGTIGFIGLVAPHTARLIIGEEQRWYMPATLLVGAILMSLTSLISKSLIPGVILPIGVITALVGIPFFLALVLGKKQQP